MQTIITLADLQGKSLAYLQSVYAQMQQQLATHQSGSAEYHQILTSLNMIAKAIQNKRYLSPKR